MRRLSTLLFAASVLAGTLPASAAVTLLAHGALSGTSDLSGLTGTLENGLPANILGGIGSGIAYAGGNTFLALPDRGPNATPYNGAVDDTVSYISRFQTVSMGLNVDANGTVSLAPALTGTTLLSSTAPLTYGSGAGLGTRLDGTPLGSGAPAQNGNGLYYFTGRSDNYGAGNSGVATNARFDPEGIRVSNDGKSVFVSDEYGPYVRQFDRATGQLVKTFTLPANLDVATLSPNGATEISGNTAGRTANKGMEGLAITPDGKTLVGFMQAALLQDVVPGDTKGAGPLRIVTIDIASGATHEYAYNLTTGSGVSEVVAINDHEFLVDERDGKGYGDGSKAKVKQIFRIDIAGATDVAGLSGAAALSAAAVKKTVTPFLDLVSALVAAGVPASQIPAKIEGLAFGQDLMLNGVLTHTLYIANDNDFVPGTAGPNQFFVFGFTDADLPGYVAQQLSVPEPATWMTMLAGFGLLGTALRRARRTTQVRFG